MYRGGYYLCVCDRPLTLVLTICGVIAICVAALSGVTLTAHMQAETVDDQDTLGINLWVPIWWRLAYFRHDRYGKSSRMA